MATDDSVLMNIKDLFEMEADRRVEQAAAVERAKAETAARIERERREREDALRAAREDERRRAEEDAEARNREVEERIHALRAELGEVRAAREQMRLEVAELAGRREPTRSRANLVVGAMAAMSLVAALTATYVSWPQPSAALTDFAPVAVAEVPLGEAPVGEAVVVATDEAIVVEDVVTVAEPTATERPIRTTPHTVRNHTNQQSDDDLGTQLDFGDDDGLIPEI